MRRPKPCTVLNIEVYNSSAIGKCRSILRGETQRKGERRYRVY